MHITELLITGYNSNEAVFAVNLASDAATVTLTSTDENGGTVIDSAWQQTTDAFAAIKEVLEQLTAILPTSS